MRPSVERCPVHLMMPLSSIPDSYNLIAHVARQLWLVHRVYNTQRWQLKIHFLNINIKKISYRKFDDILMPDHNYEKKIGKYSLFFIFCLNAYFVSAILHTNAQPADWSVSIVKPRLGRICQVYGCYNCATHLVNKEIWCRIRLHTFPTDIKR